MKGCYGGKKVDFAIKVVVTHPSNRILWDPWLLYISPEEHADIVEKGCKFYDHDGMLFYVGDVTKPGYYNPIGCKTEGNQRGFALEFCKIVSPNFSGLDSYFGL